MTATAPLRVASPHFIADDLGRFGAATALIGDEETLTYGELDARVAAVCTALGTTRRLVLLTVTNSIDTVVAYLAALRGRHAVALVAAGDEGAQHALADRYDPDVVITEGRLMVRRDGSAHTLHPSLAVLLSTSGSTGSPKLVRLSRDNVVHNAHAIATALGITADDRAITTLPLQYCYGLSVLNSHLAVGASVVLSSLSVVDPCFWTQARERGVTSFAGVPHTFELLDRIGFDGSEIPTLRSVTQAGGRMAPDAVARYAALGASHGFDFVVMYGQTEATARMAYLPPSLASSHPSSIGVAVPGGALRIHAPDGEGIGELVYAGPNVMLGYATAAAELASGAVVDELRTGDLARCRGGLFEIVGRVSRFIKPFGVRVDLDDLERVLRTNGVEAMCTGDDAQLVVAAVGAPNAARAEALVAQHLRLPRASVSVVAVDALPRLVSGKPDYAAVTTTALSPPAPATVRAIFATVLGVDAGDDDTFVSLGGDSLSYVEASIALEDILGTLPAGWHHMPVGALDALTRPSKRSVVARVDTSVVFRAVAIVLVVGTHTGLWHQQGGAHALLAIAGFNFARFQLASRSILSSVARVVIPSIAWIGAMALLSDKLGWPHALLVNNLLGANDALWSYWFLEAIVQISLVLAAVLAVPAVRRVERRQPFWFAIGALALGLSTRFDLVPAPSDHLLTWPHEAFWLFATGWAAGRASTWQQRTLVTALAVVCVPGFFSNGLREVFVIGAIAAVAWAATVPVPRPLVRLLTPLAGASLYVYLTHIQLHPVLGRSFGPVVATLGSLAAGVLAWRVAHRIEVALRRRRTKVKVARRVTVSRPISGIL